MKIEQARQLVKIALHTPDMSESMAQLLVRETHELDKLGAWLFTNMKSKIIETESIVNNAIRILEHGLII